MTLCIRMFIRSFTLLIVSVSCVILMYIMRIALLGTLHVSGTVFIKYRLLTKGLDLEIDTLLIVLVVDTEPRLLDLSLVRVPSEVSARSSASSSSHWALRYLVRLTAAISSYNLKNTSFYFINLTLHAMIQI